jgi:hypothetical protein
MDTKHTTVKVVIPVYQSHFNELERCSFDNTCSMLSDYPIVVVKPQQIQLDELHAERFPNVETIDVSDEWLGTKNGIQGYNRMMLSAQFYELFLDTEYIFICHLDAWIFSDQLRQWCDKDYDLLAPTWPLPPRFSHFPFKQWLQLKQRLTPADKVERFRTFNKIGNGGFSLRRVDVFLDACKAYASEIEQFNGQNHPLYNEDIFWALVPQQLRRATVSDAISFGFDVKPELCYRLNGHQLPMGCHGFHKPLYRKFWSQFIPALNKVTCK